MCGIVGYVGVREAAPFLLEGLFALEYRGYDSAGMAVHGESGLNCVRAAGEVKRLAEKTDHGRALHGVCGVGHTRWATHGAPEERNAHPQLAPDGRVAVVHNGVIENHAHIRGMLEGRGYRFASQTDTEAAALLLDWLYAQETQRDPVRRALSAIAGMMRQLEGSYALGILFSDQPGAIYAARCGSPLLFGRCGGDAPGFMLASDVTALLPHMRRVTEMGDMHIARLDRSGAQVYNISGEEVHLPLRDVAWTARAAQKNGYAHFMLKEMMEQPQAVRDTLAPRLRGEICLAGDGLDERLMAGIRRVLLLGCGSAYHAGCVGRHAIARLTHLPAECAVASEFGCGLHAGGKDTLAVIISQSGETADSLAALRLCRQSGMRTLAVVNVEGSAIAREADAVMLTHAGPEIAVATTKAYSAQLACLYLLAMGLSRARGALGGEAARALFAQLAALPDAIAGALTCRDQIEAAARRMAQRRDAYFIGRSLDYAACMEGSLKLKEVSYIHAEAYPAGEFKHGAISLIEPGTPVIAVSTQAQLRSKTLANMQETAARGAWVTAIGFAGDTALLQAARENVFVPRTHEAFAASVSAVPMQLLAYHAGCARGLNVDKPRNLAKSVTVE